MENNCVTIREFEVPGFTYAPGTELSLNETLLEDWERAGMVKRLKIEEKPKPKKRRTVRHKTVVTA